VPTAKLHSDYKERKGRRKIKSNIYRKGKKKNKEGKTK
jgi:hypothetical protein